MPPKKRATREKRTPAPAAKTRGARAFPIVGIGASAGGLEDTGMAFVVITHQHPGHTSLLPELLGKIAAIPLRPAEDGLKVEPNHVYVCPPGGYLAILDGTLHRMETERKEAPHLPIDYFLRSLAADQTDKAICIILSGTGTDLTLGLQAIKGESGMAMLQQVQAAKYARMPSSAVATGLADYVRPDRTAENMIDGVVVTFVDINPVKAAEKSLLRMSKVFLDGPEPMIILDLAGRIIDLNEEAVRTYGWSREEMIGQPFQTTVLKTHRKTADARLQSCLAGESVRDAACVRVSKAGRELPGSLTLQLLTDERGQPDAICLLAKHPAT